MGLTLAFVDSFHQISAADLLRRYAAVTDNFGALGTDTLMPGRYLTGNADTRVRHDTTLTGHAEGIVSGRVYVPAGTITDREIVVLFRDTAGGPQVSLSLESDGKLKVWRGYRGGTQLGVSTSAEMASSTSYDWDLKYKIHGSTGTLEVRVNGVAVVGLTALTGLNTDNAGGTQQVTQAQWWIGTSGGAIGHLRWLIDDGGSDFSTYLEPSYVDCYYPAGAGVGTAWTPSTGSNHTCVDENPPNDATDGVSATAVSTRDQYVLNDMSTIPDEIYAVVPRTVAIRSGTSGSIAHVTKSASTTTAKTGQAVSTNYAEYGELPMARDNAAAVWTDTVFNAMETGFEVSAISSATITVTSHALHVLRSIAESYPPLTATLESASALGSGQPVTATLGPGTDEQWITESLGLDPALGSYMEYSQAIAETVAFDPVAGRIAIYGGIVDETLTLDPALEYLRTTLYTIGETLGLHRELLAPRTRFETAAEVLGARDAARVTLELLLEEMLGLEPAATLIRVMRITEDLGLQRALLGTRTLQQGVSEGLTLDVTLLRFLGANVAEGLALAPAAGVLALWQRTLAETVGFAGTSSPRMILRVTASEELGLSPADALRMIFRPTITEGIEFEIAYVAPDGTTVTFALNTNNLALTEYTNYAFNSFALLGHQYLGANENGLYELAGDTDDGTDIVARVKSGFAQFAGSRFSGFKAAYLGMRASGEVLLTLTTGEDRTYTYRVAVEPMATTKVNLGKGLRARYFAFELVSEGQDFDLDSVEFVPLRFERRV